MNGRRLGGEREAQVVARNQLRTVVDGVEALYAALQPFVSRSFAGPLPMPDSIDLSGLNVSTRRASHC
jgi:hypothetical protein